MFVYRDAEGKGSWETYELAQRAAMNTHRKRETGIWKRCCGTCADVAGYQQQGGNVLIGSGTSSFKAGDVKTSLSGLWGELLITRQES